MVKIPKNPVLHSNIKWSNLVEESTGIKDKEDLNNIKIFLNQNRIQEVEARRKLSKSKKTKKTRKVLNPEEKRKKVLNRKPKEIKKEEVNVTKKPNSLLNFFSCILEEIFRQIFF